MRSSWCACLLVLIVSPGGSRAQGIRDPIEVPPRFYSVQIGAYPTMAEAQARCSEFESLGYSPLFIFETERWKHVLFGRFELHADALLYKRYFRRSGLVPDAWERVFDNTAGEVTTQNRGRLGSAFNRDARPFQPGPAAQIVWPHVEPYAAPASREKILDAAGGTLGIPTSATAQDLLNRAYLHIADGERQEALELQSLVASGEVPADPTTRLQACWDAARSFHALGQVADAYQAFRELETICPSLEDRAACRVEQVGLLMELAEREIGSHEQVRRAALQALAAYPGSSTALLHRRSTLELMFLETYARQPEPDYATASRLGEAFIERYSQQQDPVYQRELFSALWQTGWYHQRQGSEEAAMRCYSRVIDECPPDLAHFAGHNPRSAAMLGLAHIARSQGDEAECQQILRDVIELYPEDLGARRTRALWPWLESTLEPSFANPRSAEQIKEAP
jgi:tetratricopeptide (TPR) repeat protein